MIRSMQHCPGRLAYELFYTAARNLITVMVVSLLGFSPLVAQESSPGAITSGTPKAGATAPPATSSQEEEPKERASPTSDERLLTPKIDVYLPEGELDFRVQRLARNAFFEGQLNYDFPSGDISSVLRYRFYRRKRTYQLSVFDTIEGQSVERGSEYQRVRGGALLMEWPHSYSNRSFLLAEIDTIDSNKDDFQFTAGRTNTFVRVGYQLGTPDDERSNAIVGNDRGRIETVFSAHRLIGPGDIGLTAALSYATDALEGDFEYLKLEFAGLKRFRLPGRTFVIGRFDGGTFSRESLIRPNLVGFEAYDIPTHEFFGLKGRDNLKGLKAQLRGTTKLQFTTEFFVPWFEDAAHRALGLEWNSWYWIVYGGKGAIGFDRDVVTDSANYLSDVGFGFEASFRLKGRRAYLSAVLAKVLEYDDDPRFIITVKTYSR
jgi:hypothetical protein